MKKLIIVKVLIYCFAFTAHAQEITHEKTFNNKYNVIASGDNNLYLIQPDQNTYYLYDYLNDTLIQKGQTKNNSAFTKYISNNGDFYEIDIAKNIVKYGKKIKKNWATFSLFKNGIKQFEYHKKYMLGYFGYQYDDPYLFFPRNNELGITYLVKRIGKALDKSALHYWNQRQINDTLFLNWSWENKNSKLKIDLIIKNDEDDTLKIFQRNDFYCTQLYTCSHWCFHPKNSLFFYENGKNICVYDYQINDDVDLINKNEKFIFKKDVDNCYADYEYVAFADEVWIVSNCEGENTKLYKVGNYEDYINRIEIFNQLFSKYLRLKEEKKHGNRILPANYGWFYTGSDLSNNLAHGKGDAFKLLADSTIFEIQNGQFENGYLISGTQKVSNSSGEIYNYSGQFNEFKFHGQGKIEYSDGTIYEGEFKNGLYQGKGKTTLADGTYYEGDFAYGMYNGNGLIIRPATGEKYEGEFKDGFPHGSGIYFSEGKTPERCEYYNGERIDQAYQIKMENQRAEAQRQYELLQEKERQRKIAEIQAAESNKGSNGLLKSLLIAGGTLLAIDLISDDFNLITDAVNSGSLEKVINKAASFSSKPGGTDFSQTTNCGSDPAYINYKNRSYGTGCPECAHCAQLAAYLCRYKEAKEPKYLEKCRYIKNIIKAFPNSENICPELTKQVK